MKSIGRMAGMWLLMLSGLASAATAVKWIERDQEPENADCAMLESNFDEPPKRGTVADPLPGGLLQQLLCPGCFADTRYQIHIPLRRIDQRLVPPPDESWGTFECAQDCAYWLLREGDAALLVVHVGARVLCGATGNCPGRLYERAQGQWRLLESYISGEGTELCAIRTPSGGLRLWLTPIGTGGSQTLQLDWRPLPAKGTR